VTSTGVLFQLFALGDGACVWSINGAVLSIRIVSVWWVSAFPAALANSAALAAECGESLSLGQVHFPSLVLASGRTPADELWALALAGAGE